MGRAVTRADPSGWPKGLTLVTITALFSWEIFKSSSWLPASCGPQRFWTLAHLALLSCLLCLRVSGVWPGAQAGPHMASPTAVCVLLVKQLLLT